MVHLQANEAIAIPVAFTQRFTGFSQRIRFEIRINPQFAERAVADSGAFWSNSTNAVPRALQDLSQTANTGQPQQTTTAIPSDSVPDSESRRFRHGRVSLIRSDPAFRRQAVQGPIAATLHRAVVAARATSAQASKRIQQATERLRIRHFVRLNAGQAQNVLFARFTLTFLFRHR